MREPPSPSKIAENKPHPMLGCFPKHNHFWELTFLEQIFIRISKLQFLAFTLLRPTKQIKQCTFMGVLDFKAIKHFTEK